MTAAQNTDPVRIGVIGCGNISDVYLANCRDLFANLDVVAIADLDLDRAESRRQCMVLRRY